MRTLTLILSLFLCGMAAQAQQPTRYNAPGAGNPILPGYFADPTIKKFGDTYYLYSTTDGNGGGRGPSQVWTSRDFVNWTLMPMNWPNTPHYWAPDVMKRGDKYYLFYCQPCMIYCGEGLSPRGPWKNILGEEDAVLVPDGFVKGAITLDGQSFVDDDGSVYLYWGTWGIYPDHGCGVGKLNLDKQNFDTTALIPNTQAHDFFEGPFMIKKDGLYYFTYSSGACENETYRVQYAVSDKGPMGPFTYKENNPILETNADQTVHGPGHHSILKEGDNYYIIYHRHNLPRSTRGMHRQVVADKLVFGSTPGTIEKVVPTHSGIGYLQANSNPFENLAYGKKVTASSFYSNDFRPQYAVDDNNATLWRPKTCGQEWLQIDLGEERDICRVWTQFEYPTAFVQYILESSTDGTHWTMFSDRSGNLLSGSPMVDYGKARARYLRLTFKGAQNNGTSAALWNIKVFGGYRQDPPQILVDMPAAAFVTKGGACNLLGMLAGTFKTLQGSFQAGTAPDGTPCVQFNEASLLESSSLCPLNLHGENPFTLTYSLYGDGEALAACTVSWGNPATLIKAKSLKKITEGLHHIAIVCDGTTVKKYVDSNLVESSKVSKKRGAIEAPLRITASKGTLLAHLRLYNWEQSMAEIEYDAAHTPLVLPQAAAKRQGLLARIDASQLLPGNSYESLDNQEGIKGSFTVQGSPVNVVLKQKRTAFLMDGTSTLTSNFAMPATLQGNSPYSVEAWILNPELNEQEVIADLNRAGGELEKIAVGYGSESALGLVNHNGSFENIGIRDLKGGDEWIHLVSTYDGFMERIYINGKMVVEKNIVLRLPLGSDPLTIGCDAFGSAPFTGYLSELSVYDTPLTGEQVNELYHRTYPTTVALELNAASMSYNATDWSGEGDMGGKAHFATPTGVSDIAGRIAIASPVAITELQKPSQEIKSVLVDFATLRKSPVVLTWDNGSLQYTKERLILTLNGKKQEIACKATATGWAQWVWLPGEGRCYVNGEPQQVEPATFTCEKQLATGEKCARVGLYYQPFTADECKRMQAESLDRALDSIKGNVSPATPTAMQLTIADAGKAAAYSFCFGNGKSGWTTGWTKQSYARESNLATGSQYPYLIKVRDKMGHVAVAYKGVVKLDEKSFQLFGDDFSTPRDYVQEGCKSSIWDGVQGFKLQESAVKSDGSTLALGSAGREFTAAANNNGPFLYKEIKGDFVMQVELTDFSGYRDRKAVGLTEGGLMVMLESPAEGPAQQLIHLGCFPYWNVGNMVTDLSREGRPQYFNKKGYDLDRYMQIEHNGDYFFIRTSPDGITWEEIPNTPLYHPELSGKSLKVGLYQVSYQKDYGTVNFDNFKLWIKK